MQVVGEASVVVQMVAVNAVLNLSLASLCGKSISAGMSVKVAVEAETEDAKPLSSKALDGFAVKLAHGDDSQRQHELRLLNADNATQSSYAFESDPMREAGDCSLLLHP